MEFIVPERDTEAKMLLNSPAVSEQGLLIPPICIEKTFLTKISDHAANKLRLTSRLVVETTTNNNNNNNNNEQYLSVSKLQK